MKLFDQVEALAFRMLNDHQEWRIGQAYFNALRLIDHRCADAIRGTPADPFYDNSRAGKFWSRVTEWDGDNA